MRAPRSLSCRAEPGARYWHYRLSRRRQRTRSPTFGRPARNVRLGTALPSRVLRGSSAFLCDRSQVARRSSEHPGRGLRFPGKSRQEDDTLHRQIAAIANFEDLADNRAIWMVTRAELVSRLEQAFLDHGYAHLTMITIADIVDVTRRTLYNYFSSKEEAFRFLIEHANANAVAAGMAAGRAALAEGQGAVEILASLLDVRDGNTRRRLARSPHAIEINDQAFRRCRDIMVGSAVAFQAELAALIVELEQQGIPRQERRESRRPRTTAGRRRAWHQSKPAADRSGPTAFALPGHGPGMSLSRHRWPLDAVGADRVVRLAPCGARCARRRRPCRAPATGRPDAARGDGAAGRRWPASLRTAPRPSTNLSSLRWMTAAA